MSRPACSTCFHWTQKGKTTGPRLCRHPDTLRNSTAAKESGTECWLMTGPNFFECGLHWPVGSRVEIATDVKLEPGDPIYYDAWKGSHVKVGEAQVESEFLKSTDDVVDLEAICNQGDKPLELQQFKLPGESKHADPADATESEESDGEV